MSARWAACLGSVLLAALWAGPPGLSGHPFAAHMVRHMGVVAVASPLIALALRGTRLDPAARRPRLFAPVPVSLVELAVVWGWHAPAPHRAAHASAAVFALEQASFLVAGLWLWLACLGTDPAGGPGRAAAGVAGLLLTALHMTLLGVLLALAPRPLYGSPLHAGGAEAALADQQLGGVVMLLTGGTAYLAGGLCLLAGLLRARSPRHPLA